MTNSPAGSRDAAAAETSSGVELLGLAEDELRSRVAEFLRETGAPSYRAKQIREWLYTRDAESFDAMDNLPKTLRGALAERFVLHPLREEASALSRDGTRKFLWRRSEGNPIESVVIPDRDRVTYCVSTQAGCPVKCTFCATGYGGFQGQLSPAEVVDQVVSMRRITAAPPTNLVFMGMGEPLLNFDALLRAIGVLTDAAQIGLGARRLTVSTIGVPERIVELARRHPQVKLALSLHAPDDDLRTELIPLNRQYPLAEVLRAVAEHARIAGRMATFEYVVLPGVNDSETHARSVVRRLEGIPSRINLIGFNPFAEAPYEKPSVARLETFRGWLEEFPGPVTIRRSRGEDIAGACGQLSLIRRGAARPKDAACAEDDPGARD